MGPRLLISTDFRRFFAGSPTAGEPEQRISGCAAVSRPPQFFAIWPYILHNEPPVLPLTTPGFRCPWLPKIAGFHEKARHQTHSG